MHTMISINLEIEAALKTANNDPEYNWYRHKIVGSFPHNTGLSEIKEMLNAKYEKYGYLVFELERVTYKILNTKQALTEFQKKFNKHIQDEKKKPQIKKRVISKPRQHLSGEVQYFNEYIPLNHPLIQRESKVNIYTTDGFYSDGCYAVKIPKPGKLICNEESHGGGMVKCIPPQYAPAYIQGIANTGISEADKPVVIVVDKDRPNLKAAFNVNFFDSIFTIYPKAKVNLGFAGNWGITIFTQDQEVVGVVMPLHKDKMQEIENCFNPINQAA